MLLKYPVSSWSILITSVLNCASARLAISLLLSCIFSGALIYSFIWAIFFVSAPLLCSKGWSLRYSPRQGTPGGCIVILGGGECPRGNNTSCSAVCQLSITSSATDKQIGLFWCRFLSRWVCVHSGPLWVSSNDLSCEAGSFSRCRLNPHGYFQSEV